jgi:hypothetical protein
MLKQCLFNASIPSRKQKMNNIFFTLQGRLVLQTVSRQNGIIVTDPFCCVSDRTVCFVYGWIVKLLF